jgi:protein TonB
MASAKSTYTQKTKIKKSAYRPVIGTVLVTAGIFLLLPFTQWLGSSDRNLNEIMRVDTVLPPPPPPPPEPPPEEPEPEPQDAPDIQQDLQQIDLSQLEVALNPGTGGGWDSAFAPIDFGSPDAIGDMIFEVSDLDRVPRVVRRGRLEYPFELRRSGIEGVVRLLVVIDTDGRVRVQEVIESSNRAFVRPAIEAAENSLYETPTRNGEPVRTRFILPIRFSLSNF